MNRRAEVTWSIMHPVKPEADYMREVIVHAAKYHVDSFEICGDVHASTGSIDGAIRFRDYPAAAVAIDTAAVTETMGRLREVVALAHGSGRPVYYWHREVMVPRAIVAAIPGLLDANGEFDLLGDTYQQLIRSKIREFFENVPEMDGLVLTLTESDYSVIHNSDPARYPPAQVVRRVVETFAAELQAREKRFVLRSFGSIAQDYEDILAGAALVSPDYSFEVETKITPYDFSPFLRFNPWLRRIDANSVSAEYDSIGEFLGAGYLPAPDPARVLESVRYAQEQGVSRHVIRVDRIGHPTFASAQAINLHAFDRAIRDETVTAEDIWREWAAAEWPGCASEMTALMRQGIELVKKTHFIDGHVIFHAFPIQPELKWIKACGILGVFRPGMSLAAQQGMWGIDLERTTPARDAILREKDEAVALADAGLQQLIALRDRLSDSEFQRAETAWRNATVVTRAIRHWCRAVCAYFEGIESDDPVGAGPAAAIVGAARELAPSLPDGAARGVFATSAEHEYGGEAPAGKGIASAYLAPMLRHLALLRDEYAAELRERRRWRERGAFDFVVPGGLCDDGRVQRAMHASHARLIDGRPARLAGNRVFPNGFIEVTLALPRDAAVELVIEGDAGRARQFTLGVDDHVEVVCFSEDGVFQCPLPAGRDCVCLRIQKSGAEYPAIFGLGVVPVGRTASA